MAPPSPGRLATSHSLRSSTPAVAGRPVVASASLSQPSVASAYLGRSSVASSYLNRRSAASSYLERPAAASSYLDRPRAASGGSPVGGLHSRQLSAVAGREASTTAADPPAFRPGKWDIWFLGIAIGFGGQYFGWNAGLKAGLYSFLVIYFVVGLAYIMLCCCTSEITGALPFAGGAYGLSRCTLGFYAGFIIGCVEALEYITYVSTAVLSLTTMLVDIGPWLAGTEPALALVFYLSALVFHCRGGKLFWRWNLVIGVLSLFFVLLYCVGSFRDVDFALNADTDPQLRYIDGLRGFVTQLPLACWFFVGVEALNLATDDVASPRTVIPFAQLSCIAVLFGVGVVVLFVTVSLPPPGLNQISKLLAPFNNGFQLLFNVQADVATLFSIPAMYATTFCFMWGYGKLISAMATSKLLPLALALEHPTFGTPVNAVVCGSVLSYLICLLVYFVPAVDKYLYNLCMAAAFLGYMSQCVGYIALRVNYPSIRSSSFRSPFGVPGAVYSLAVWIVGFVSVCGFQEHSEVEVTVFLVVVAGLSAFYFAYARGRQTFSQQETRVFLLAHIIKFGMKAKRERMAAQAHAHAHVSGGGPALIFPVDRSADDDEDDNRRPVADPARAESPFYRQYCLAAPADPIPPRPEAGAAAVTSSASRIGSGRGPRGGVRD